MAEKTTPAPVPAAQLVAYETHEERVQAMERDGFVYFPGVLDAAAIEQLRACSDRIRTIMVEGGRGSEQRASGISRTPSTAIPSIWRFSTSPVSSNWSREMTQ